MPKRVKHSDVNQTPYRLVDESTAETDSNVPAPTRAQISALMAQLGRKGGKIGGKRRLKTLSSEERKQIARKAARARWAKETKP